MSTWNESLVHSQFLKIDVTIIMIFVCCIANCIFIEKKRIDGGSYRDVQKIRSIRRAKWAWIGMFTGYFSITTFEAAQYIARHGIVTTEMQIGVLGFGMLGTLAGGLWGSIKGRRMQAADGLGSADAILYSGSSSKSHLGNTYISMTKISSSSTQFYKRFLPLFLGGFFLYFILGEVKFMIHGHVPVIFIVIICVFIADFVIRKNIVSGLSDEIYDCGDFLFIKNNDIEERVELSNIMKVNVSTMTSPQQIVLKLVTPGKFGQEIKFSPIAPFLNLPFLKNKIAENLIVRVDQARKSDRAKKVSGHTLPLSSLKLFGTDDYCIDLTIGRIFKDRFTITTDTVTYGKITMPLSEISRLRWGMYYHGDSFYKKYVSYQVCFGSDSALAVVECALDVEPDSDSLSRYNTIVNKLWKAAGIKMLTGIIERIAKGEVVRISDYVSADVDGLFLPNECLYDIAGNLNGIRGEQIHCDWSDISYLGSGCQCLEDMKGDQIGYWGETHRTWSDNGRTRQSECLRLTSKRDSNISVSLSYRDADNTHIIEALLSFLLEGDRYCMVKHERRPLCVAGVGPS